MDETHEFICEWLEANGWKKGHCWKPERDFWFYWFEYEPRCATNDDKRLQVCCEVSHFLVHEVWRTCIEVDLTAEPIDDKGWVKLRAYAFDSVTDVPEQVERLLVAWRAIHEHEHELATHERESNG